ncbi:putative baseplate assembly protein [Bradyrhizobium sp. USDA 3315]
MDLRLNLDDIDFERLLEDGRSSIPGLAPDWTDHNVHDPGIMLIELLAFEAEAQIYALSRLRRDERVAYAKMLGISLRRPASATALIWPAEREPQPPGAGRFDDKTIDAGARMVPDYPDAPAFVTDMAQFITGARLVKVTTHFADGRVADQTRINRNNGATFLPFGPAPSEGDSLVLGFIGRLNVPTNEEAVLVLGVETQRKSSAKAEPGPSRLRVALRDDNGEQVLDIIRDTTGGMLTSGVLMLAMPRQQQRGKGFEIVLRAAAGGLVRPPRLRRIAANVISALQRVAQIEEAAGIGTGLPDQVYSLREGGWIDTPFFSVTTPGSGGEPGWTRVADFENSSPTDQHFTFDPAAGLIQFGNGVNGRVLPAYATLAVDYFTCAGAAGNLPAGVGWTLRFKDLAGRCGENGEPCSGGRDADTLDQLQVQAIEHRVRRQPYVTAEDLAQAAIMLAGLGVARAIELPPDRREPRGTRVLLVVGARDAEGGAAPESAAWLETIRMRLAPRVPLGQRLCVIAPRYVDVRITARLAVARTANVAAVRATAEDLLAENLAATNPQIPDRAWAFGRDVTALAVKAWLRRLPGVTRVGEVALSRSGRAGTDKISLAPQELPRLVLTPGDLTFDQPGRSSA